MARQQPIRVVVEKQSSGCGTALAVLFVVGVAVVYWYISLTLLAIVVAAAVVRSRREREKARHKPGPRDPWLNEVAVALADLGWTETARNTGAQLGGTLIDGDIGLDARGLRVFVTLFSDQPRARQAELGLKAKPEIRSALASGLTAITTVGRVVFVANGRGAVVDEFRFDEVVRVVGRLAVPPALHSVPTGRAAAQPAPAGRAAGSPSDSDALEQLRKLGELRAIGVVSAAEFEAKKAELLGRI
jgi:hypothetical protein